MNKRSCSVAIILIALSFMLSFSSIHTGNSSNLEDEQDELLPKLENPMSVQYLRQNLRQKSPRLILTPSIERDLKKKIKTNPVVQNIYKAIQLNAEEIKQQPVLERIMEGRRLLGISREMLYRMNILGMVYTIEKDAGMLNRINDELLAICNFSDWNPSHFLDVAEMSMAVAIAIDWTSGDLPGSTIELAKKALIEKGILPSFSSNEGFTGWITASHNWNPVCHGGLIAASIAIADKDPELAVKTISRALDNMPYALVEYGPDGVYPEGSTYWSYGTGFTVLAASMFESAFGTDFGIADYPAFKESATFKVLSTAPSDWYYNFGDCSDKRSENGDLILAWFAAKIGNKIFFEKDRFLRPYKEMERLSRHAGAALVWLSQFEEKEEVKTPSAWKGAGANPVVIFTGGENDPHRYYFGGKGGKASVNHGNMDAGSFIFEVNDVRWVIDPGNQGYYELEKTGFNLWDRCQECERWTLLTKNNFGHSTISVNNQLHLVDGLAGIVDFKYGESPEATIDMSPTFEGQLKSAKRKFKKDGPYSLLIEDEIEILNETELITWQLMTTADIEIIKGGAILKQDGKQLSLEILSHPDLMVSIISLDPPPLELDRRIEGLKRLEIRMPAYLLKENNGKIAVRLSGM